MSERLKEVKTSTINICSCESCYCDGFTLQWVGVEPEHFDWLIEQAELVKELEEANKNNYWIASDFKYENLKLEQQNKRYRELLKNTQVAIQKNLSKWNYKDEVVLHDVFIHNKKLLEGDSE